MSTLASYECGMLSPLQVQMLLLLLPPLQWVVYNPGDIPSGRQHSQPLNFPDSCPHRCVPRYARVNLIHGHEGGIRGPHMTGAYLGILTLSPHGSRSITITLCRRVTAGYTATLDERHVNMYMSCMSCSSSSMHT